MPDLVSCLLAGLQVEHLHIAHVGAGQQELAVPAEGARREHVRAAQCSAVQYLKAHVVNTFDSRSSPAARKVFTGRNLEDDEDDTGRVITRMMKTWMKILDDEDKDR